MTRIEAPIEIEAFDECFTHKDEKGVFRTFITGAMARFAKKWAHQIPQNIVMAKLKMSDFPLDHLRKNMGIEQERIDRLDEPYLSIPVIGIWWPDGMFTLVDGNHRVVKKGEAGEKHVLAYIFKFPFWEHFLLPIARGEEALTTPSGMLEHEQRRIAGGRS